MPRATRGRGGRGAASWGLPGEDANEGVLAHDFVLHLRDSIGRRISLPSSFSILVSELGLEGFWLRFQGYPYCTFWESSAYVFLETGWKLFARQFNLHKGDSLYCRFDGEETLSMRAFDAGGNHLEPCWESLRDGDSGGSDDTRSSAPGGGSSGRGITGSRSLNSPSEGSDS